MKDEHEALKKKFHFTKKLLLAYVLVILAMMLLICSMAVWLYKKNLLTGYYIQQSENLCKMANSYRNISIINDPELTNDLPPSLDCNKILYPLEK